MNKPTTITLPDHLLTFVEGQVAAGHYGSLSEAVQAAVQLLEEQEAEREELRQALIEGEQSGPSRPFNSDEFLARMLAEHKSA